MAQNLQFETPIESSVSPRILAETEAVAGPAHERITAEELSRAVAAVEARRAAHASFQAGTITVGEAIRELDLEAKPEEIWAEIAATRRAHGVGIRNAALPVRTAKFRKGLVVAGVLLTSTWLVATVLIHGQTVTPQAPASALNAGPNAVADFQVTEKTSAGPVVKEFSEIADDHPIAIPAYQLQNMIQFDSTVDPSSVAAPENMWTVVKHRGALYIQGYLGLPMSPRAMQNGPVTIWNVNPQHAGITTSDNSTAHPVPITLDADKIKHGTLISYEVLLPTVSPDAIVHDLRK
jgi:hypothetical protein